jgi:hypothetical protein
MPSRKPKTRKAPARSRPCPVPKSKGFVGRDASPVLDHYPPKDASLSVKGPARVEPPHAHPPTPAPTQTAPAAASPPAGPAPAAAAPASPTPLISLERPFNVDEFSSMLGETSIRVTVPREDLAEVLRRVSDFMGFGIYVYSVAVRPLPGELLKSFVVELQRVDYSPGDRAWVPFVEQGTSDSPFGPSGTRT